MMNGYSKIHTHTAHKSSRSIDFSDFFSFPQTPKPSTSSPIAEEPNKTQNSGNGGERFGVILGRSGSVSSSTSGGFQATMKRAFSMRRSSSVSERYCRIHDQDMAIASDDINKKKHSGGGAKILKACKRLLGL
ncbi:hypothetical protein SESBI_14755 [Sesbania bispinosa]|nr:hypothetical protein SESBI_14755 [Sesbania bispinosa]